LLAIKTPHFCPGTRVFSRSSNP